MGLTTAEQVIALVAVLLGGWLIGYSSAPSAKLWRRRMADQSARFKRYHDALQDKLHAAERRAGELDAELALLRAERVAVPERAGSRYDDLTRLRGIDEVLDVQLVALGVTRFADLADLSDEDEIALERRLALPAGYIAREQWRAQAELLRGGRAEEHAAQFGVAGAAVG